MRQQWALFASACICMALARPAFADGQSGAPAPQPVASTTGTTTGTADTSQTGSTGAVVTSSSTNNESPAPTASIDPSNPMGVSIATGDNNPFADVPTDSFAYKAIVQLHSLGYLKGYPDGLFQGRTRPDPIRNGGHGGSGRERDGVPAPRSQRGGADERAGDRRCADAARRVRLGHQGSAERKRRRSTRG